MQTNKYKVSSVLGRLRSGKSRIVAIIIGAVLVIPVIVVVAIQLFISPPAGSFEPRAWHPAPGFTVDAKKIDLAAADSIKPFIDQTITDPEDVAVDAHNAVYVSSGDGSILRIPEGAQAAEIFANVGGRPLGIAFDSRQHLLVANQGIGLQSVAPDGSVTLLAGTANGTPIHFANDLAIARDGGIYFSDSNSKYNPATLGSRPSFSLYDFLEGTPRGRLLHYNPATKETKEVLGNLYFPNGVVVTGAQDAVLVTESTRYRITRYWLSGEKAGTTDIFLDNVPGILDGFTPLFDGNYALPMYERSWALDTLILPSTLARQILVRVPALAGAGGPQSGSILILTADGQVVRHIKNIVPSPSNVAEFKGQWLLGSLSDGAIRVMPQQLSNN